MRYPMRSFPSDLAVQAGVTQTLTALSDAVEPRLQMAEARIAARRARLTERMRTRRAQLAKNSAAGERISPAYLSRAIGETLGPDAVIFNEYPLRHDHCAREKPGTFFSLGPAGGLGWGFGAALGAKLAAPDAFVVATLGDGAYMFGNPTVSHWVAGEYGLPILTIIFNNSRYGAVRDATLSMFKDGVAGEDRRPRPRRSRSLAAIRRDRPGARRLCRARREAVRPCRCARCARATPWSTGAARRCSTSSRPTKHRCMVDFRGAALRSFPRQRERRSDCWRARCGPGSPLARGRAELTDRRNPANRKSVLED